MARIPGRSLWIAAPAGILCAAVIAALVWLAVPMAPVVITWAGDALRDASARAAQEQADDPVAAALAGEAPLDCRDLYPAELWRQLAWFPGALLGQSVALPDTAAVALAETLGPTVRVSCQWRTRDGQSLQTVLSAVGPDAAALARPVLEAAGFACRPAGTGVECDRRDASATETHVIRDGVWLAHIERGWHPEDYAALISGRLWG